MVKICSYPKNKITMVLWQFLNTFKSLSKLKKQFVFSLLYIMKRVEQKGILKRDFHSSQNLGDCFRFLGLCMTFGV